MAHEIRNPLAAMCGSVQMLSASADIQDQDARLLAIVTREAERLNSLITEFLMYARPATPRPKRIFLCSYIEEELVFINHDPRFNSISIHNDISKLIEISVDPDQFHQVVINLLHNAADVLPEGGEVSIKSSHTPGAVRITFTDSGAGLSVEASKHLFEPFWTSKSTGTGLGLAISYRIIEAHGGKMSVESPIEGGCRFVISLPME
jgi:two-component system sensor histidine kinase PilS (NtrC family)